MKTPSVLLHVALALLGLLAITAPHAGGQVVVVAPTASTNGSVTFTQDITFTITTAGNAGAFILDDWVTNDGTNSASVFSGLAISQNGGASFMLHGSLRDNLGANVASLTVDDGYFNVTNSFGVAVNDTITVLAGTYTLGAADGFNPQATQTFTGNMFITDTGANRISEVVLVPEPTTLGLLIVGGMLGLAASRRRVRL